MVLPFPFLKQELDLNGSNSRVFKLKKKKKKDNIIEIKGERMCMWIRVLWKEKDLII